MSVAYIGIVRDHSINIRVSPGHLDKFDVFVQSTSVNRKLVGGHTLAYRYA